jgi:predicted PurR-regulated permease PerM
MPDLQAHTPPAAPTPVAPAAGPDASKAMTLFVMIVATLYFGRDVLMPVTLALLLAFLLSPLVTLLRRLHLGRTPSVLLAVIVALGIVIAIGGVIGTQLAELTTNLPQYAHTIETKVDSVRSFTLDRLSALASKVGAHPPALSRAAAPGGGPQPASPAPEPAAQGGLNPLDLAQRFLTPVLSPLATLGIVFIVAVFALLQEEDLRDRLIRLLGSDDLHRTTVAIDDGGRRLSRYFITQLSINTSFGVIIGLGLLLVGVPNPILFGILSAILRFVPYVGSLLSAVLPMTLAAAVEPGWSMVLWTAGLYVVVEGATGQIIEPLVYGHSTGLSPFSVVVAALFWSWLWGPIGLILSTPLTLCIVVLGRHIKRLEFLDVMLGDRAALTPVESFYQRILAGDADEAQDQAEQLLRERSLTTYYDEVALRGLQMAASDGQRGVLNAVQLNRIKGTIKLLVEGLQGHEDKPPPRSEADRDAIDPPEDERELPREPEPESAGPVDGVPGPWAAGQPVMCIAGRGPLDEAAAAMLVQLLGKHGMGGRLVPYDQVSREQVNALDVDGVRMACISYLDLSGRPAHLRYLIRRLRARLPPGAPILVGLWPLDDAALHDRQVQAELGADHFTSSLQQAVSACAEVAKRGADLQPPAKAA